MRRGDALCGVCAMRSQDRVPRVQRSYEEVPRLQSTDQGEGHMRRYAY